MYSEINRDQSDGAADPVSALPSAALSIVIPCWNETAVLAETHRRVSAICRQCCSEDYEIVLVDDGSG